MATPQFLQRQAFAVCATFFVSLLGNAQDILWEKSYGGKHAEYLTDAVATADYGFILAGSSLSSKSGNKTSLTEGDLDYWVWKMDETGEMEWQKSFGGSGSDFLQCVRLTKDGGFLLAGHSNSPKSKQKTKDGRGDYDFWIIKLDAGGGEQWQKTIGGSGDDKLLSAVQTKDGGYILGGSSNSEKSADKSATDFGNMDYWVVKINKDGIIEWQQSYGGTYFDELRSIEQTQDGGYIVGGYSNSPESGNKEQDNIGIGDYWLLKISSKGIIEWQKVIGGDRDDQLYVIRQTYDGGFVLGGNSNSGLGELKSKSNSDGTDFWVVKINLDGEIKWQETYNFGSLDILTSIVENKDHSLLIGGYAKSEPNTKKDDKGINDFVALKVDEKGSLLWQKSVGSDGDDALRKLIETRDGGYILAGTSSPLREMRPHPKKPKKGNADSAIKLGNGKNNGQLQNTTNKANDKINETANAFNEEFNEQAGSLTEKGNKAVGSEKDSALQFGVNQPSSPLGKSPSFGSGSNNDPLGGLMDGMSNRQATMPPSGDKKSNFGSKDFWVVKLKDKMKEDYKRVTNLEAMPNPTSGYTNVVINYEYKSGTATVVDISGHVLNQFSITDRIIPVDLSAYPEGIYVINIKTEAGSEGIKVVKTK